MATETLAAALEREHHEIDGGIEAFTSGSAQDSTDRLTQAMEALRRHIYLEEEFLFPPLRAAGMMAPIFVMIREHGELWRTLDTLKGELAAGTDGAAVQQTCRELLAQLDRHNSKEEPVLYPQADAVLTASANAELRSFLASSQLPDSWVCQGARA